MSYSGISIVGYLGHDPVADQTVSVTTTDNDTAGFTVVQSGGNLWLVVIARPDGKVAVVGDEGVGLYASRDAFFGGEAFQAFVEF